ncbi:DUF305 domain-containing protein [Belnapia sp. F-4-1]|uniref:DUF305 domain-containing protein n=1 Tax=Belnapia sp. F-4-1 TaxID=1545443 RepID=UPI001F2F9916|nr:DUF305 domain-containing protein [Belnapia sp. F-4-1]
MNAIFSRLRARRTCLAGLLLLLGSAGSALPHGDHEHHRTAGTAAERTPQRDFLAENDVAMTRMMQAMAVPPSGDIDRDFVAMMTAHHQGAIDMATALLRHGGNEQLRRLAQEIVITQQAEIAAMQLAIGTPLPRSVPPSVSASTASSAR